MERTTATQPSKTLTIATTTAGHRELLNSVGLMLDRLREERRRASLTEKQRTLDTRISCLFQIIQQLRTQRP